MTELIYIGGVSGGIDSQAAARFMLNRYGSARIVLVNSDAGGNEHPLTIEHIDWYSEHVCPIEKVKAKVGDFRTDEWCEKKGLDPDADLTFPELARIKGRFQSRKAQFCTEALKLAPIRRWIDEVVAWAKTDRGGRQNNLFRILPPPSCESRFGLCE